MWVNRLTTSNTLFACTVVNTKCPVSADWMAICAVSESRISPTMILSGSWRRMDLKPRAKVRPFFSLTGICSTPCNWYSTGSSIVTILSDPVCVSEIAAYKVVVLPLQLGHDAHVESKDVEPQAVQPLGESLLVEGAQHRIFAEDARNHRYAEVDRTAVERDAETAVLGHPALRDVEFRHHLDAGDHLF